MKNKTMEVVAEGIMTDQEFEERKGYVTLLRNFHNMSLEAMKAIEQIKLKKLYRPYKNLAEFCMAECGWSKNRYSQIKKAFEVKAALPPKIRESLTTESQAIELSKFPEEQRADILTDATHVYSKDGKTPTTKDIKEAGFVKTQIVDKTGHPIPSGDASYHWSKVPQAKDVLALIHAAGRAVKALDQDDTMYRQCSLQTVLLDLRNAYQRFKGGIPAYVCTKCEGKNPRKCDFCLGVGMLGTWRWDNCGDDDHGRKRKEREKNGNA